MSDDDEMVTIEVPVALLDACEHGRVSNNIPEVQDLFRKAREARKSKYERWRERIKPYGEHFQPGTLQRYNHPEQAQLMAAAPQLLEMVVEGYASSYAKYGNGPLWGDTLLARAAKAIRAALPADVADEVLS